MPFSFLIPLLVSVNLLDQPECTLTLKAPDAIDPSKDTLVELVCRTPTNTLVHIPDLDDRWQGFSRCESIPPQRRIEGDAAVVSTRLRLTPAPTPPYRLAPFVLEATTPSGKREYATAPLRFAMRQLPDAPTTPWELDRTPIPVAIGWRGILRYALYLIVSGLLILLFWRLTRSLRRRVVEAHYTPAQKALADLERLLAQNLPTRGRVKDFYVGITRIVRQYIQRTTGIRATNQTTEEFLLSAKEHAISKTVTQTLGAFLHAADYVKFARAQATPEDIDRAVATARTFIESDERERQSQGQP
ncbi:MAG: hypothetical protein ACI4X9_04255 [Kiritimatiellia bacterium]